MTDAEAFELVKFFDSNGNARLTFQEFIQMFLPCEDNVLRNLTMDRPSIRVGRFDKLPVDIELGMTTVITKEVELARRLAVLKKDLELGLDFNTLASFRTIDKFNSGVITTVNLGAFLRDNGHIATESELLAIVRRLDTKGNASVTYTEWLEFMGTPSVVVPTTPITVPAPLPRSYYYSRYYDWPYSPYYPYSSYLDYKYGLPSRYYSPYYYPSYSRYPYYPLGETKTVTYDVEKPTPYSPARTVKRETYHSPLGSKTFTSYL